MCGILGYTSQLEFLEYNELDKDIEDYLEEEEDFNRIDIDYLAGDFLLSGFRILGKVYCHQGGHQLSNLFLRKIFSTNKSFHLIDDINSKISENFQPKKIEQIAVNA